MAKERLVVNEFIVPGGLGGVAVRRACELVLERPGLSQKELLMLVVEYSGLNFSTAGWITSPGNPWNGKSPATRLWDRRKEGVFSCYPNEFTDKVVNAQAALFDETVNQIRLQLRGTKFHPRPGDLVSLIDTMDKPYSEGLVIGYSYGRMHMSDPVFSSIDEIIEARPHTVRGDRAYLDIIENGTGRQLKHWMLGNIRPV